jgi:hypothetical protein
MSESSIEKQASERSASSDLVRSLSQTQVSEKVENKALNLLVQTRLAMRTM